MSGKPSFVVERTTSTAKLVSKDGRKAVEILYETAERDDRRLNVMVYWVLQAAGRAVVEVETMTDEQLTKIEAEMQEKSIHSCYEPPKIG